MEEETEIAYELISVTKAPPEFYQKTLSSSSAEVILRKILDEVKKFDISNLEVQPRPWEDPKAIQIKDWLHKHCPIHLLVMLWEATRLPNNEGNKTYPGLGNESIIQ